MSIRAHNPLHPGEFIRRVYLEPFEIGSNELAKKLKVTKAVSSRLINCKSSVTPAMALRLSKVLGRTPESWLIMQDNYNLKIAREVTDLSGCEAIEFEAA